MDQHDNVQNEEYAARHQAAIEGLNMLIEKGGNELLIVSYKALKAWLQSMDEPGAPVAALREAYMQCHMTWAATLS